MGALSSQSWQTHSERRCQITMIRPLENSKIKKSIEQTKTILSFIQWMVFFYGAYTLWAKWEGVISALDLIAKK